MNRARRGSIVSSIASHTSGLDFQELPTLLDDSYLFNKLEKLALVVSESTQANEAVTSSPVEEPDFTRDDEKYNKYTIYLAQLESNVEKYEKVLEQSYKVRDQLEKAIDTFNGISLSSNDFVSRTKGLYGEYSQLSQLHENIPKILQYFTALDPIVRRLNHASSPNVVRKTSFKVMLTNIDESLFFLEKHPDLGEAELYRIKFKRCLVRACELIANYLNGLLNQITADISHKITSSSTSGSSREALLYNKFEQSSEEYQTKVIEILSRVYSEKYQRYNDELNSILSDCYEQYFQKRMKLLRPGIMQRIDETVMKDRDVPLANFIEDGKSYFQQLCIDEFNLFIKFFDEQHSRDRAMQWLCQLSEPLYDCIRTRILRETDISMLCDSVTLFGQYYQFEENSEEYQMQFHTVQFDKIFEPIVQKLQARLILRVQIYIQQNIVNYVPSKDSFIISSRKNKISEGEELAHDKDDSIVEAYVSSITQQDSENEKERRLYNLNLYYPPLIKSLALLSKIYEMLNSTVFDDLAHHIVHDCIVSLRKAYNMVKSSPGGSTNLDVKLSFLRNLLLLRQEMQNFNIQYTVSETYLDFSGVESFFKSVTEGGRSVGRQDSSVLGMAKALVPKVINNMVDARSELMNELRIIIKDFTEAVCGQLIGNTLDVNPSNGSPNLLANNAKLRKNLEDKLPRIYAQISTFIDDSDIVTHLLDAIQEAVVQYYNDFYEDISEKAETGALDKSEVSELMYNDVFADFLNNITSRLTTTHRNVSAS